MIILKSYQSKEFQKFFWAINCCSYKIHGFHKILAFSRNFRISRKYFRIPHFREKNVYNIFFSRNATEKFRRNLLFAGNPSRGEVNQDERSVSEFNEFEPRLKSAKNWFQLSAGLNSLNSVSG